MTEYLVMGLVLVAGLYSIICAIKEVEWFFNSRKASPLVDLFGFKFAKGFYIVLGLVIIILSLVPISKFFGIL